MNTRRPLPALVPLAVGALLASGAALGQNVARDIPADPAPAAIPDDATLKKTVESNLRQSPGTAELEVNVKADNGVVTLSGVVVSRSDSNVAEVIARSSTGVTDVKNRLIVRDGPDADNAVPDPRGASWDPPRTTPTPVTPGAPSLPNGVPTPAPPRPPPSDEE